MLNTSPLFSLPTGLNVALDKLQNFTKTKCPFSLAYLNVRNLSIINENFGYDYGDLVINLVPKIVEETLSSFSIEGELHHIQEDKFLLFLPPLHKSIVIFKDLIQRFNSKIESLFKEEHSISDLHIIAIEISEALDCHPLKLWDILRKGDLYLKSSFGTNFLILSLQSIIDDFTYFKRKNALQISPNTLWRDKKGVEERIFSSLPSILELKEDLQRFFKQQNNVNVICLLLKWLKRNYLITPHWWENKYLIDKVANSLLSLKGEVFRSQDIITIHNADPQVLFLLLSPPRKKKYLYLDDLNNVANRIKKALSERLLEELGDYTLQSLGIFSSEAQLNNCPEYQLLQGLEAARQKAYQKEEIYTYTQVSKLNEILENKNIHILLQPIFCSTKKEILGYEALLRGNSKLENPEYLLYLATKAGILTNLEKNIIKIAVNTFLSADGKRNSSSRLFLNISPELVQESWFQEGKFLESLPLPQRRLVFEISYRDALFNPYLFSQALITLKKMKLLVAIDDFTLEYQDLSLFRNIPTYIKFDIFPTLKLNKNLSPLQLQLLRCVNKHIKKLGLHTIMERLEVNKWYDLAVTTGIDFVQGYFLEKPKVNL
jgi:EAL domain-containing protein (putative c-di-GMP-specific phosphodiesterase class I)/GGDEF domain-containing protein